MYQSKLKSGLFITFEGGEGAGKTTLLEEIGKKLHAEGYEVLKTREPGGTKLGENIRAVLLDPKQGPISPYAEIALFLASRAQHIQEVIVPALEQKKIILCDRFNDSTVAYQGAARGLGMDKTASFCEFISQGLQPNLTFYLDLPPEVGLARASKRHAADRIEAETLVFHNKIREAYLMIHKANLHRVHVLDAMASTASVFQEAMKLLHPLLLAHHV